MPASSVKMKPFDIFFCIMKIVISLCSNSFMQIRAPHISLPAIIPISISLQDGKTLWWDWWYSLSLSVFLPSFCPFVVLVQLVFHRKSTTSIPLGKYSSYVVSIPCHCYENDLSLVGLYSWQYGMQKSTFRVHLKYFNASNGAVPCPGASLACNKHAGEESIWP